MSTPALDRAAEESFRAGAENAARRIGLAEPIQWSSLSREDQEHVGIQARAAVSAALHAPDDPDALARDLASAAGETFVFEPEPEDPAARLAYWRAEVDERRAYWRRVADAVRAAILGEA